MRGPVAQLVEQLTFNQWVTGSNPVGLTMFYKSAIVDPGQCPGIALLQRVASANKYLERVVMTPPSALAALDGTGCGGDRQASRRA